MSGEVTQSDCEVGQSWLCSFYSGLTRLISSDVFDETLLVRDCCFGPDGTTSRTVRQVSRRVVPDLDAGGAGGYVMAKTHRDSTTLAKLVLVEYSSLLRDLKRPADALKLEPAEGRHQISQVKWPPVAPLEKLRPLLSVNANENRPASAHRVRTSATCRVKNACGGVLTGMKTQLLRPT
jgi:hypothetical protein